MHSIQIAAKAMLLSVVAAAVGILTAAMLTFAANNVPVVLTQAEPYPPEPVALPANLITATPDHGAPLQDPQHPKSTEGVENAGKENPKRLAKWRKNGRTGAFS